MNIDLIPYCEKNPTPRDKTLLHPATRQFFNRHSVDAVYRKLFGIEHNRVYILADGIYDGPWCVMFVSRVKPYIVPHGIKMIIQNNTCAVLIETIAIAGKMHFRGCLVGSDGETLNECIQKTYMRAFKVASGTKCNIANIFCNNKRVCRIIYNIVKMKRCHAVADQTTEEYLVYNHEMCAIDTIEPEILPNPEQEAPPSIEIDIPHIDIPDIFLPCFGELVDHLMN